MMRTTAVGKRTTTTTTRVTANAYEIAEVVNDCTWGGAGGGGGRMGEGRFLTVQNDLINAHCIYRIMIGTVNRLKAALFKFLIARVVTAHVIHFYHYTSDLKIHNEVKSRRSRAIASLPAGNN